MLLRVALQQSAANVTIDQMIDTGMNSKNLRAWRIHQVDHFWGITGLGAITIGDAWELQVFEGHPAAGVMIYTDGYIVSATPTDTFKTKSQWKGPASHGLVQNGPKYTFRLRSNGLASAIDCITHVWYEELTLTPEEWLLVRELGVI